MSKPSTRYRKPNLLVALTLFVGVGLAATTVAQAAEPYNVMSFPENSTQAERSESWWQSVWGLDLAKKLQNWRPKITPAEDGEGFHLARPFGKKGAALQFSSSLPDSVQRSLREGGDSRFDSFNYDTDAYLFIQKRW